MKKKAETQKMAPLLEDLTIPCPSFSNIAVDLAGPYQVFSMLKRRGTRKSSGTMKVWALLAVCLNTRALRIYLVPGYSTEDFLVSWAELEADCGIPTPRRCTVIEDPNLSVLLSLWRLLITIGISSAGTARVRQSGGSALVGHSGEMAQSKA